MPKIKYTTLTQLLSDFDEEIAAAIDGQADNDIADAIACLVQAFKNRGIDLDFDYAHKYNQ